MRTARINRARLARQHCQGVNFLADFHSLSSDQVRTIVAAALAAGYRAPANASGSYGRCAFEWMARDARAEAEAGRLVVPVALRRDRKDRTPVLFFYEGGALTCYAHVGQHSAASLDYMQRCTKPADPQEVDAAALLAEWNNQPPRNQVARVVRRLTPKA